jgi:hypothetical protein
VPNGVLENYKDVFLVFLESFIQLFKNPVEQEKVRLHWNMSNITLKDLILLAGVEEAAHRAFYKKKRKRILLGRDGLQPKQYHASDDEYRALLWKFEVIKKYFPQYQEEFKAHIARNKNIRHKLLNPLTP